MENCTNCNRTIGKLETAHVHRGEHVVCEDCWRRLNYGDKWAKRTAAGYQIALLTMLATIAWQLHRAMAHIAPAGDPSRPVSVHIVNSRSIPVRADVGGSVDAHVRGDIDATVGGFIDAGVSGDVVARVRGDIDTTVRGHIDASVDGSVAAQVRTTRREPLYVDVSGNVFTD